MNGSPMQYNLTVSTVYDPAISCEIEMITNAANSTG